MTDKDETGLNKYKGAFKLHKKKLAILTSLFKNLNLKDAGTGIKPWMTSFKLYVYYTTNMANYKLENF